MKARWAGWIGFAATLVPLVAGTGFGTLAGALWIAPRLTSTALDLTLLLLAALGYIGVMLIADRAILASALLVGFGAAVGGLVGRWLPGLDPVAWVRSVGLGVFLLVVAFVIGRSTGGWLRRTARWLWAASWAYLLGWIAFGLWGPSQSVYRSWALAGAAVFWGLAAAWFASLDVGERPGTPRQAAALYLIGLNVVIALALALGLSG